MNVAELATRVIARFPDAVRLDETVVKFVRRAASRPFAVCYLDCTADIPRTAEALRSYQDRVIGQRYFEGPTSLQWNNYLYFVVSGSQLDQPDIGDVKDFLEQDRAYARKFVVSEDDIDEVLAPTVVGPGETGEQTSVLSIWNNRLAETGLGPAIWGDADLPRRLAVIEAQEAVPPAAPEPTRSGEVRPGRGLSSLELALYRRYPLERRFRFGKVNLVFGPNASGKTSLLEAIELFYCGRNKRTPEAKPKYDLRAVLSSGEEERVTNARRLKDLRQRNLHWYGQPEVLTNNLYTSFARFNFLDTDAAVHLAEAASSVDEDLSRLLIGPDAAKIWESMLRVHEAVRLRLKDLQPLEKQTEQQIADLVSLLQQTASVESGSDHVRRRLVAMMRELGWRTSPDDPGSLVARLVGPLSELVALARQASQMPLTSAAVSRGSLATFARSAAATRSRVAAEIDGLAAAERRCAAATAEIARAREARGIAVRLGQLVAARIPLRVSERDNLRRRIATASDILAGLDPEMLSTAAAAKPHSTVRAYQALATAARAETESRLQVVKAEQARVQALRERRVNLAGELKEIVLRLIEDVGDSECPVCHTKFGPGDLVAHIGHDMDGALDRSLREVLARVRECEDAYRAALADEVVATAFVSFCVRAELAVDTTLELAQRAAATRREELSSDMRQLEVVERDLKDLADQGQVWTDLEPARIELVRRRFPLAEATERGVNALVSEIDQFLQAQMQRLAADAKDADARKQQIATILGRNVADSREAKIELTQLDQLRASAEALSAKLAEFDAAFRIPTTKPLGELAVEAEAVRQVALELQAALRQEEEMSAIRAQSEAKRQLLEPQLGQVRARIRKLSAAGAVLQRLQRDHPLSAATQVAINQNRGAIESIFRRIHAPREFAGLGDDITTLRRVDGGLAPLGEISTGQRAALGLSIFLAQNMKLSYAPPVILVDDPIAHVDDLNCLAFLDYLREIALTGRRQIFFATAHDKMASMFQRKCDFLGPDEFRAIELHRETQ